MPVAQQVAVKASQDRRSVAALVFRPIAGRAITEALEEAARGYLGARVRPADFTAVIHRQDDRGTEYSFGTLGAIDFEDPQRPEILSRLVHDLGEALIRRSYELVPVEDL